MEQSRVFSWGVKIVAVFLVASFFLPMAAFGATRQVVGVLDGKKKKYTIPLNDATYQTLFNIPDYTCRELGYAGDLSGCYNFLSYDRTDQREAFAPLVNWLNKKIKKSDDRVRVAASIVQKMEYDYDKYVNGGESNGRGHGSRYPYETLFENKGICGEKGNVIVYLLKQLGYSTAEITFTTPALHQVAGVKCAAAYDFRDTGYCFVDPISRHMITFAGSYKDSDPYLIVPISDGKTFNAKKDFKDARGWWKVLLEGTGSSKNYKLYKKLVKKYGM